MALPSSSRTTVAFCLSILIPAQPTLAQSRRPAAPAKPSPVSSALTDPIDPRLNQGPKTVATGDKGMVSTQLVASTDAALKVLKDGGNAVDAALTAMFVQQVHDYHMVFLYGSMSALYYDAKTGKTHAIVAIGQHPDPDRSPGGKTGEVVIGGTVRGAAALSKRFGSKPWASLVEPAIKEAEDGAIVTSYMYGFNFGLWETGLLGDLRTNAEARRFYMPDGHLVGAGQRWKMPALANTLREVAKDPDYMYTGAWGKKFVDAVKKAGMAVTAEDLAEYQPEWTDPTRFTYRGHELLASPPPDTGGLTIGFNLNVLENFDLKAMGSYMTAPDTLEVMTRTMARTSEETMGAIRDPLSFDVPAGLWLDKGYGKMVAEFVKHTQPKVSLAAKTAEAAAFDAPRAAVIGPDTGSDHIVVADSQGNWISMLHTIHGGAPGIFIDGVRATGSGLPAPSRGPGRRLILPISAVMAMKDGKPWLAMGTPGNPPQPVTEVLVNILDFDMAPNDAAEMPRFWAVNEGHGVKLQYESRLSGAVMQRIRARGLGLEDLGAYNYHTGSMQIVWRDPATGKLMGSTDQRRLGNAQGY